MKEVKLSFGSNARKGGSKRGSGMPSYYDVAALHSRSNTEEKGEKLEKVKKEGNPAPVEMEGIFNGSQ